MIRILNIIEDTMVDGPGLRTSIYCAGCAHQCPNCHNPQTWSFQAGHAATTQEMLSVIMASPFANVTFTGGDPMFQPEGFTELALAIHAQSDKNIWCFTGFLYEQLLQHPARRALLQQIDVLVDGPFLQEKHDPDLIFRGSTNQRIIDVQASLQHDQIVTRNLEQAYIL